MGVGLYIPGRLNKPKAGRKVTMAPLGRVRKWLQANAPTLEDFRQGETDDGTPALFAELHPAAEELEIQEPGPGRILALAKTSTAGPGYHIYVCDLLKRMGEEMGITWDEPGEDGDTGDETGYFHTGDRAAVEDEMLRWLKTVAGIVLENLEGGADSLMISMPMGRRFECPGASLTPLGPRDADWWRAVSEDPRQGIDLFPWWDEGMGPAYHLGLALTQMWQEVRWRTPLFEREADVLRIVHDDLATAFRDDPDLAYPWSEWAELIDHYEAFDTCEELNNDDVVPAVRKRAARDKRKDRIGYRRWPVHVDLAGGWSITIPGAMAEEWKEGTWSAWDGQRTVWFTALNKRPRKGPPPNAQEVLDSADIPAGEGTIEHTDENIVGRAVFGPHEEDGEKMCQLSARSAVAGTLVVCNIFVHDKADRDWALETWRSLRHADARCEE